MTATKLHSCLWPCCWGLVLAMIHIVRPTHSARTCPSKNWKVDIANNRCLLLSSTELDYKSALASCEDRVSRLFVPKTGEELSSLTDLIGFMNQSAPLWTGHIILAQDSTFRVYDDRGMDVSECSICPSLLKGIDGLPVTDGTKLCGRLFPSTMNWTATDCSTQHQFVCQYQLQESRGGLNARDIAAIAVAAFILLCFLLTLAIDFFLHIRKQKQVYADDTSNTSDKCPDSLDPPVIIVTENLGSKKEFIHIPPSPIPIQA